LNLEKYSIGIGDRFGHQGKAQLSAIIKAKQNGVDIAPVWNKSHREHSIVGTNPADVRTQADAAVKALGWDGTYYVDADHINLANVDSFIEPSNFFTLDVADYIGKEPQQPRLDEFIKSNSKYLGSLQIPRIAQPFEVTERTLKQIGRNFLFAINQARQIYQHIADKKGVDNFVTEVSMDETDRPQSPIELFFILSMVAAEGIPAQTIAPKFTGGFNKGVDYIGDVDQFEKEFNADIAVINFAVSQFSLPENLKLSVHSGSDKFAIYSSINKALKRFDTGLHLKTAGTTWLEELIGLAEAGGDGLQIAKDIYANALDKFDELCKPYAAVINIDKDKLPAADKVNKWDSRKFTSTLRHDPAAADYNINFRQLLHVGYKIAAQMGSRFTNALEKHEAVIAENVTENIYQRHINPIFINQW
jgi:hypothetical protein